jgi:hypothetical protein
MTLARPYFARVPIPDSLQYYHEQIGLRQIANIL